MTSTATRTSRKSSGSAAMAAYSSRASSAACGCAALRIGDEVHLVGERLGTEPAAPGSALVEERVAQCAQEVAEVVLVAEEPRAREHARVRLLDEVFRILA